MLKLMGKKIFTILRSKFCLSIPIFLLANDTNDWHGFVFEFYIMEDLSDALRPTQ